jgi:Fic family protein
MATVEELGRRYPHIKFSKHWELSERSIYLLGSCEAIVRAICHMPMQPEHRRHLLKVSLIKGAQATTAIEGNTLTDAEIERVSQGESLAQSKQYQEREVRNILDAMNLIFQEVAIDGHDNLISPTLIKRFHRMVGKDLGEHFDAIPGQFRTDERFVGPYKCPRGEDVENLVTALCQWLQREFGYPTNEQTFAQAVVQSIITHVYLEWIHPFGDGNGRTGRLLEFFILLRGGNPDIASHILSNFYNQTRAEYYRQIDHACRTKDLSAFLAYAIQGYYDGLNGVLDSLSSASIETAWKYLVHSRFAERSYRKQNVHKRRRRLALAMPPIEEGLAPDEIMMLTPELAREYAALVPRTLLRDLDELIEMEILVKENGRYRNNLRLLGSQMAPHRRRHDSAA